MGRRLRGSEAESKKEGETVEFDCLIKPTTNKASRVGWVSRPSKIEKQLQLGP